MQRYILVGLLLFTCLSLNAQQRSTIAEVNALLNDGLHSNYQGVREKSSELAPRDRLVLFNMHQKSSAGYTVINLFSAGFAIGSILQGDPLGYVAAGVNAGFYVGAAMSKDDSFTQTLIICQVVTAAASLFLPSIYASRYNSKLVDALHISDDDFLSIAPQVGTMLDGTPTVKMNMSLGF